MPSNRLQRFLAELGPGLVTGAADDDPSGISTYSVAGASFGYATLWTALLSFPLMAAVQLMCARLGMVTGRGLASVIRSRYPRWVLWFACSLVIVANVFNIGADLAGMADAMQMVSGIRAYLWTPFFACLIMGLLFWTSYRLMARTLKWLTLVLFAYVVTAFLARPDWIAVIRSTFTPHLEWNKDYISVLVGILGTTISPYLFFWQAAQEVEEDRDHGKMTVTQRRGSTNKELRVAKRDVITGMLLSNLIMYFLILTTAATLHAHGNKGIETAKQAAAALRPLAGAGAYWLFTLGIIGTGMLAVPVLAGSSAYAIAEGARWRSASLNLEPGLARKFYAVIAAAILVGLAFDYAKLNAVRMLFLSAVLNGLLAPPLIIMVVLLTSDRKVMGNRVNSPGLRTLGWACVLIMSAAAIALLTFLG
ncbi:Nramp family divalent metal transporter [Alloacidobacterium sp.]|uniref:Nramp family divalent metal transporter n=1 Tax=Alloacidobacterium sp. TaxID=2951999 RepID=UPI002D61B6D2|nr:Nramp family divalent metal transporter [Alloacidobacterium sp.]HYK36537.1 Nramp family divalent metal transporter [Alloacidobacterium sp.]